MNFRSTVADVLSLGAPLGFSDTSGLNFCRHSAKSLLNSVHFDIHWVGLSVQQNINEQKNAALHNEASCQ